MVVYFKEAEPCETDPQIGSVGEPVSAVHQSTSAVLQMRKGLAENSREKSLAYLSLNDYAAIAFQITAIVSDTWKVF